MSQRKTFSEVNMAEAKRRYEAGDSLRKVALSFGAAPSTMRQRALDDGWVLRPPSAAALAGSAASTAAARARRQAAADDADDAASAAADGEGAVDRTALAAKLRAAVEVELAAAEQALGRRGPRSGVERVARTLASLVRTLNELRRLDAGSAAAEEADEPFADLDSLRRELARRLAGLGAGGDG